MFLSKIQKWVPLSRTKPLLTIKSTTPWRYPKHLTSAKSWTTSTLTTHPSNISLSTTSPLHSSSNSNRISHSESNHPWHQPNHPRSPSTKPTKNCWPHWTIKPNKTNKTTIQSNHQSRLRLSSRLQRSKTLSVKSWQSRAKREGKNLWTKKLIKLKNTFKTINNSLPKRLLKWSNPNQCSLNSSFNQANLCAKRLSSFKKPTPFSKKYTKSRETWTSQTNTFNPSKRQCSKTKSK